MFALTGCSGGSLRVDGVGCTLPVGPKGNGYSGLKTRRKPWLRRLAASAGGKSKAMLKSKKAVDRRKFLKGAAVSGAAALAASTGAVGARSHCRAGGPPVEAERKRPASKF